MTNVQKYETPEVTAETSEEEIAQVIRTGLRDAMENLYITGQYCAKVLQAKGPEFDQEAFCRKHGWHPGVFHRLVQIGRGEFSPHLLLVKSSNLVKRLERCSLEQQQLYVDNGEKIDVVVPDGNGDITDSFGNLNIRKIGVNEMVGMNDLQKQVFADDHVRSPQEQRTYLESINTKQSPELVHLVDDVYLDENDNLVLPKSIRIITRAKWRRIASALTERGID